MSLSVHVIASHEAFSCYCAVMYQYSGTLLIYGGKQAGESSIRSDSRLENKAAV